MFGDHSDLVFSTQYKTQFIPSREIQRLSKSFRQSNLPFTSNRSFHFIPYFKSIPYKEVSVRFPACDVNISSVEQHTGSALYAKSVVKLILSTWSSLTANLELSTRT